MKINSNYLLREIAGEKVIIPIGNETKNFNGLISANAVAVFILENIDMCLSEEEIINKVLNTFECEDIEYVKEDIHNFILELKAFGIIED